MKNKICTKCRAEKLIRSFSKRRCKKDGLQSQCKNCVAEYSRTYRSSSAGKEACNRGNQKYQKKFPERRKARQATYYAVKVGKLQRPIFCEICGLPVKTEGHHPDYGKLLEVDWLCKPCHAKLHLTL